MFFFWKNVSILDFVRSSLDCIVFKDRINGEVFGFEFYVKVNWLAVRVGNASRHIGVLARTVDALGVMKERNSRPSGICEIEVGSVVIAVIAELAMERIISDRDAACQVEILEKIADRPSTVGVVVDLKNKTRANRMRQAIEVMQETLRDNSRVAVLTAVNVERRDIVVRKVEQVEKLGVRSEVANTVGDGGRIVAGERDELGRMRGDANASALDGSGDSVECIANVRPVGQVAQREVNVGMIDDRSERRGETIARDASVGAVLNGSIGNDKIIENALAESANSVDTRQRRETSVRHCLELESTVSKNVGDAAKGKIH